MKKKLLYIIILGFCFLKVNSQMNYDLIGDWINSESRFIISFTDSTVGFYDWFAFQEYYIQNDTIFFEAIDKIERDYSTLKSNRWEPKIIKTKIDGIDTLGKYTINQDTLIINILNDKYFWGEKEKRYFKLKPVNNIQFDSIFVMTTTCYGLCPMMELQLKSNGEFYFSGQAYTENLGFYTGYINNGIMQLLNSKLNQLNFSNYDSSYIAGHTDGQTKHLVVYHDGNKEYIEVYGHEEEPLEINVFFHYMTELYKWTRLVESEKQFEFMVLKDLYPPPPPPPSDSLIRLKHKKQLDSDSLLKSILYK